MIVILHWKKFDKLSNRIGSAKKPKLLMVAQKPNIWRKDLDVFFQTKN